MIRCLANQKDSSNWKFNLYFAHHKDSTKANLNIGLALSLIRLNFKYLSISQEIDNEIMKKIQSIAKEKRVIILFTENFLNLENYL